MHITKLESTTDLQVKGGSKLYFPNGIQITQSTFEILSVTLKSYISVTLTIMFFPQVRPGSPRFSQEIPSPFCLALQGFNAYAKRSMSCSA